MRPLIVLSVVALFALPGVLATPAGVHDEAAFTVDLSTAKGPIYFIKCANDSKDLTNCPWPSLWQQTNGYPGLQTTGSGNGFEDYRIDTELLG